MSINLWTAARQLGQGKIRSIAKPALLAVALLAAAAWMAAIAHQPAHAQTPACGTAVETSKTDLVADCTALLKIKAALLDGGFSKYEATKGPDVKTWGPDVPIANWEGVKLDGERVVAIKLLNRKWKNKLRGTLSADIGALSELRVLDLSGNKLTGALPSQLGTLSNLRVLKLTDNKFTGAFPTFTDPRTLRVVRLGGISGLTGCFPKKWTDSKALTHGKTQEHLGRISLNACP